MLWLVIFFKKKILSISFLTEKLFRQRATNKQQNNVPEMFMLVNYYRMNRLHQKKKKKAQRKIRQANFDENASYMS